MRIRSATVWPNERRAVGQDHRELLAAEARHRVHRPDAVAERVGDRLEDHVAGLVAVRVVDALEVVDVDHQHERRLAGAGDAVDLAGERQLEVAAVGQAGERIAAGELAEAVDHRLQPGGVAGARRSGRTCPDCCSNCSAPSRLSVPRSLNGGSILDGHEVVCEVQGSLAAGSAAEARSPAPQSAPATGDADSTRRGRQRAARRERADTRQKPSGVGRTCLRSRSTRPRRSASASGRSIVESGSPVRSPKRAISKPSPRRSALSMNSNGSSARATSSRCATAAPAIGLGHVGAPARASAPGADAVRKAELAVRAGADAEVVAELPVVEVVRAAVARPRERRDLVALEAAAAVRSTMRSSIVAARSSSGSGGGCVANQRVGLDRQVVDRQVRRLERERRVEVGRSSASVWPGSAYIRSMLKVSKAALRLLDRGARLRARRARGRAPAAWRRRSSARRSTGA